MLPLRPPLCLTITGMLALALLITPTPISAAVLQPTAPPPLVINDAEPPISIPQVPIVIHTVQSGETLRLIAARYGTNIWALAKANNLSNPDLLHLGQPLVIPQNWELSPDAPAIAATVSIADVLEPTVENIQAYIIVVFAPLGLDAQIWALRVANCESRYTPHAVNESGNWHGLFQYHPITWAEFSSADIYDWQEQVRVTAHLYQAGQTWRWACR